MQATHSATTPIVTADCRQHLVDSFPHDAARIDRAVLLVQGGHVEREQRPGRWIVVSRSRQGVAHHVDARATTCTCEDYARQSPRGAVCMHVYAVELYLLAERAAVDAEQSIAIAVYDDEVSIPFELVPPPIDESWLWESGETVELPLQCTRCHRENANQRHPDGLCDSCIARELFGDSDDAA